MNTIRNTTEFHIKEPTAVAVGKFDGIHLGHRKLLDELFAAKKNGLKTAVFTFDPSPAAYFAGLLNPESRMRQGTDDAFRELMTAEEKRSAFARIGIDYLVEFPFDHDTAGISPEEYVKDFLLDRMQAKLIAAGEDVSFGKNGAGNADLLRELAAAGGVSVRIIPKLCHKGREISSSLVREAVLDGRMDEAELLLGEAFGIGGIVEEGNRIGRTIGMPTANLYPSEGKLLPPNGVYASKIRLFSDVERALDAADIPTANKAADAEMGSTTFREFSGITNIGCKPTIAQQHPQISAETHIFDFDEDIYGRRIEVKLYSFIRKERQFPDLDALKAQMKEDVAACRAFFQG